MATHLLSVVLPTHNRPDRLETAARSVLDQEGGPVELVIVDDASGDHTPEVCGRLADDPRVRVVRNAESLGPAGSRNRGMAVATGDLVGFCDDDDAWLPGAASVVCDRMDRDPGVGVVTSWHQVVHDRTGRTAVFRGPQEYRAEHLLWFDLVAIPFGVIRRSHFPDDLAVDTDLPTGEDWDLWLRCARIRPMVTVPRTLYAYHQHGGARVTRVGTGPATGRQRFLDKHGPSMSPSCRAYHRLVVAGVVGGRGAVVRQLGSERTAPGAAAVAASVLAAGSVATSVARRRRDPGLPARLMRTLVDRLPAPPARDDR
jgi:glycosyltransferase involved in cell wall biosynthesis